MRVLSITGDNYTFLASGPTRHLFSPNLTNFTAKAVLIKFHTLIDILGIKTFGYEWPMMKNPNGDLCGSVNTDDRSMSQAPCKM